MTVDEIEPTEAEDLQGDTDDPKQSPYARAVEAVEAALHLTRERLAYLRSQRDDVIAPEIRDLVVEEKKLVRMARFAQERASDDE